LPENFQEYAETFDPNSVLLGKLRKDLLAQNANEQARAVVETASVTEAQRSTMSP
jgi:hypothetical protein